MSNKKHRSTRKNLLVLSWMVVGIIAGAAPERLGPAGYSTEYDTGDLVRLMCDCNRLTDH